MVDCNTGKRSSRATLLQINMELERSPLKTTILYIGSSMGFHVNLGEGRSRQSRGRSRSPQNTRNLEMFFGRLPPASAVTSQHAQQGPREVPTHTPSASSSGQFPSPRLKFPQSLSINTLHNPSTLALSAILSHNLNNKPQYANSSNPDVFAKISVTPYPTRGSLGKFDQVL